MTGKPETKQPERPDKCATCGGSSDQTVHKVSTYQRVPGGYGHPFVAIPQDAPSVGEMPWTIETMMMINKLTPDIHGKAFDPDWFLLRQRFEEIERRAATAPVPVDTRPTPQYEAGYWPGYWRGRLEQFHRMKNERPADPIYWDMHEETRLRESALGGKEDGATQ